MFWKLAKKENNMTDPTTEAGLQEIERRLGQPGEDFIYDNPGWAVEAIDWYEEIIPQLIAEIRRLKASQPESFSTSERKDRFDDDSEL